LSESSALSFGPFRRGARPCRAILHSRFDCPLKVPAVTRSNMLFLIIGALAIAVAVLGYQLYQDRHQPEGLHINVGPGGLSIQGK
jgi:hypothetical protein